MSDNQSVSYTFNDGFSLIIKMLRLIFRRSKCYFYPFLAVGLSLLLGLLGLGVYLIFNYYVVPVTGSGIGGLAARAADQAAIMQMSPILFYTFSFTIVIMCITAWIVSLALYRDWLNYFNHQPIDSYELVRHALTKLPQFLLIAAVLIAAAFIGSFFPSSIRTILSVAFIAMCCFVEPNIMIKNMGGIEAITESFRMFIKHWMFVVPGLMVIYALHFILSFILSVIDPILGFFIYLVYLILYVILVSGWRVAMMNAIESKRLDFI